MDVEIAKINGRLDALDVRVNGKFETLEAKFDGMQNTVEATLGEMKAIVAGQPAKLIVAIVTTVGLAVPAAAGVLRILDTVDRSPVGVVEPTNTDQAPVSVP